MRNVYPNAVKEHLAFAEEAGRHFVAHPEHWSYTRGEIAEGELIALRWGLAEDCVLVFPIGEDPTVYAEVAR